MQRVKVLILVEQLQNICHSKREAVVAEEQGVLRVLLGEFLLRCKHVFDKVDRERRKDRVEGLQMRVLRATKLYKLNVK